MTEPTPGEIMRRLDEIANRFERASQDIRDFRNWAERLFVPRGEWVEGRRADQRLIDDVADDVSDMKTREAIREADAKAKAASDLSFRRSVMIAVISAAMSAVIAVTVLLASILFGGG